MNKLASLVLGLVVLLAVPGSSTAQEPSRRASTDDVWTLLVPADLELLKTAGAGPGVRPRRFQALRLEPSALDAVLVRAPGERTAAAEVAPAELTLPTPDGGFERFAVVESPILHPDLERWLDDQGWPLRTYQGRSLDRPATTARLDWGGPAGFHAMVYSPEGNYFVDPYWRQDRRHYASYRKRDAVAPEASRCDGTDRQGLAVTPKAGLGTGGNLRVYRTAVAATAEYTASVGNVAQTQMEIVTVVNRVNLTFERELSVRLELVADNSDVIYDNPATDPFTSGDTSALLTENQANMDTVIGSADYDLGHVFDDSNAGHATVGGVCGASKASGTSGIDTVVTDGLVVDMVAHEMGHQLGANHSFNSTLGSCNGTRNAATAYEPGGGTTIMSSSGDCDADDVRTASDDHFHGASLDEMLDTIATTGTCSTDVAAVNLNAPTVTAGGSYTIPASTPFELDVTASGDADGDSLTYAWDELDLGPAATLADGDNGASPLVRSLLPSTASSRRITGAILGETLPSTDRTMSFRVTVRDNHPGGGRVGEDTVSVTSVAAAGPFRLTAPNGGEETPEGSDLTVTWDVAGTAGGAVATPNVDVLLSTDGGTSFPTVLAAATPNDGSQLVTLPAGVTSSSARVLVRGTGNVFFDTSDADFFVGMVRFCRAPDLEVTSAADAVDEITISGNQSLIVDFNLSLDISHTWIGDLTVHLEHVDTGTVVTVLDRPGSGQFGCDKDDIAATLDDEAATAADNQCDTPPPAIGGSFAPANPLAAFDGQTVDGTWRLTVNDAEAGFSGTLNEWCLLAVPGPILIFSDGFETGNTFEWSATVP